MATKIHCQQKSEVNTTNTTCANPSMESTETNPTVLGSTVKSLEPGVQHLQCNNGLLPEEGGCLQAARFSIVSDIRVAKALPCTKERFYEVADRREVTDICQELDTLNTELELNFITKEKHDRQKSQLKNQLPALIPMGYSLDGGRRKENLRRANVVMLDIDHIGDPEELWKKILLKASETEGICILLAHVTPSGEGLRLLADCPLDIPIDEAQRVLAEALGLEEYDKVCKDISRLSYLVPRSYILHIDEDRLFDPNIQLTEETDSFFRSRMEGEIPRANPLPVRVAGNPSPIAEPDNTASDIASMLESIVDRWVGECGIPDEGNRNNTLYGLVCDLAGLGFTDEQQIFDALPDWGLDESEVKSTIRSACKEERQASRMIRDIYDEVQKETSIESYRIKFPYPTVAEMRQLLPHILQETVGGQDKDFWPMLMGLMPLLGTYLGRVSTIYATGEEMHLGLMTVIHAPSASGKGCVTRTLRLWLDPMHQQDKGLGIERHIPMNISRTKLLQRLQKVEEVEGRCLFSEDQEIDTMLHSNSQGCWAQKTELYRKAFDRDPMSQDYYGVDTLSGWARVAYNWTITGTDGQYVQLLNGANQENGLGTRLIIVPMEADMFAPMPHYTKPSEELKNRIRTVCDRLDSLSGLMDFPLLARAIEEMSNEIARKEKTGDRDPAVDVLRKRALVIGFRCGVIHHLVLKAENGEEAGDITPQSIEFAKAVANYVLVQQLHHIGDAFRQRNRLKAPLSQAKGNADYDKLPSVFTHQDMLNQGMTEDAAKSARKRWKKKRLIVDGEKRGTYATWTKTTPS